MTDTAVVQEPKATEEPPKEAVSGEPVEPSLDEILNEWDEKDKGAAPEQTKPEEKKPDPQMSEVLDFVREAQAEKTQSDIAEAVKTTKDGNEALSVLGDTVVRRYLEFEAAEDPRVKNAWMARNTNPEGWNRVLKGLGDKLAKEIQAQPDQQLTNDREAARTSVRGSSTQAPPEERMTNEHLNDMSDAEFRQEMAKHGYRRRV